MKPTDYSSVCRDYERIEEAIRYIETRFDRQPELRVIADHIGLSEFHFQRLFSRWVGISPKWFLQYLTKEYVKELLARPINLLDATYDAGLSSPGRLHDLFVTCRGGDPRGVQGPRQGADHHRGPPCGQIHVPGVTINKVQAAGKNHGLRIKYYADCSLGA